MIDVSFAVAARLIARVSEPFAFIGTLADLAALADVPRSTPCAYVVPLDEQAAQSETIGSSVQLHEASIGVLIVARHAGDASGARGSAVLHDLRQAVHGAIVGWSPPECHSRLAFTRGSLDDTLPGGTVIWRDEFVVSRLVQRPAPLN